MKSRFLSIFLLFVTTLYFGQSSSLDVNYDARAIAMGESFVANTNGLVTADNNPATLIGQNGISVFYNRRNLNWSDYFDNSFFYSFGVSAKTAIGNFALLYKRFDLAETKITYVEERALNVATVKPYYYTAIISYANNICDNFTIGINLKTHGFITNLISSTYPETESNNPIIADLGVLYNINGFINQTDLRDKLNLGASLTNYGTNYKTSGSNFSGVGGQESRIVKLPRLLKLGFAYELNVLSNSQSNLFRFVFTGEYNNLLNDFYYYSDSQRDYWGFGMESSFMDILSLRLGGVANPFSSIYGEKGILNMRYGFGINLPFELLGCKYPLSISFDYAVIPINHINYLNNQRRNLDAFNISICYNNPLF